MKDSPASNSEDSGRVFDLLHEKVKRWIWSKNWTSLRDIQGIAIEPILEGKRDVLICAGTASGKTEAALLPISSKIAEIKEAGITALYIGPLKALINDQFQRMEELFEDLQIPVTRWHGDVPGAKKHKLLKEPKGVLLITPESLEAIFVLHGQEIPKLFGPLSHVVVDELHAYIGSERGRQLQSLLNRLDLSLRRRVPRVGLSATLGDPLLAAEYLRPGASPEVLQIKSSWSQDVLLQVRGYRQERPKVILKRQDTSEAATAEVDAPGCLHEISADLYKQLRGSNNLVFANSRLNVEAYADCLRDTSDRENVPNEFFAHHGSLAKEFREDVEARLKSKELPVNAVCTSTLEMGIDIGTVKSVAQIGAPHSVAAMRQRLGRSGRRGDPSILRLFISESFVEETTPLQDAMRVELVQAIAMVRLMIQGWCESPLPEALHLSTLVQQTLSLVSEKGAVLAQDAWVALCKEGPFKSVGEMLFIQFLQSLGRHDLITQLGDGQLTLGLNGEKLVGHYSFYTAFQTPEEWHIMKEGRPLGTIPFTGQPIVVGMNLVLAGRRWRVTSVEPEKKFAYVVPSPGGRVPRFQGSPGIVHDRIREEMLAVYKSTEVPNFLDPPAADLLQEGRGHFARNGLSDHRVIAASGGALFFPWKGDRVLNTLLLQFLQVGLKVMRNGVAIQVDVGPEEFEEILFRLSQATPSDPLELAKLVPCKALEKHDVFLTEDLLAVDYAAKCIDVAGARRALRESADLYHSRLGDGG